MTPVRGDRKTFYQLLVNTLLVSVWSGWSPRPSRCAAARTVG